MHFKKEKHFLQVKVNVSLNRTPRCFRALSCTMHRNCCSMTELCIPLIKITGVRQNLFKVIQTAVVKHKMMKGKSSYYWVVSYPLRSLTDVEVGLQTLLAAYLLHLPNTRIKMPALGYPFKSRNISSSHILSLTNWMFCNLKITSTDHRTHNH